MNPRVFGAAARGDDREDSDLDLFADPAPGMALVDVGGIVDEVEKLVGVKVGVLTPGALRAGMFESVVHALRPL